jgi:hypothetical protein
MSGRWCGDLGKRCKRSRRLQLDVACGPRCRAARPTPTWTDPVSRHRKGSDRKKTRPFFADLDPPQTPYPPRRRIRCSGHKRDLSDPSPALLDARDGLRTRSLNDPRQDSLPTVQTVTLLNTPPRHLHQVETRRIRHHPSLAEDPGRTHPRAAYPQRRSSNANSLQSQNSAGSPQILRPFKGIICGDISEFESHMLSHAVGSLWQHFACCKRFASSLQRIVPCW